MLTTIITFLGGILGSIGKGFAFAFDWFWNKATLKLKLVIVGGIAGLAILGYILYLQSKLGTAREDLRQEQFERKIDNVNALTNQIIELEREGNAIKTNANAADAERRSVDNRDSGSFNGSGAKSAFCRRFPRDSACQQP